MARLRSSHGSLRRRAPLLGCGALALSLVACDGTSSVGANTGGSGGGNSSSGTGNAGGGTGLPQVDKVDIVFAIDNSTSMADKQEILSIALTDMISSLTNPPCVDGNGDAHPAGPLDPCPAGSAREFLPVLDIHLGVVSSSLGGHGAAICSKDPARNNDDRGHLISRKAGGGSVATYQNKGFLSWDPAQRQSPPGDSDVVAFTAKVRDMVLGAGQAGCGYEAQLESWYRFLVDPEPSDTVKKDDAQGIYVPEGIDQVVLAERADFLRPDSLLAIVMLSDEDDCSYKEYDYFPVLGEGAHLPRARAICETHPNDTCCASCASEPPAGCAEDPSCTVNGQLALLSDTEDPSNLRCWDQKRRFGVDFAYPVDRYISALTSTTIPTRAGDLVANPIFSDLSGGNGATIRDPGLVILTGIVGVPWQDIARDPTSLKKGIKSYEEFQATDAAGNTTWDIILGDPANNKQPADPFMVATPKVRTGQNPVTGDAITPPGGSPNPINGTDYTVDPSFGDLQYACIMPIKMPRDCTLAGNLGGCDCGTPDNDSPLCAENPDDPDDPTNRTLQVAAKAYPGGRHLSVLKGIGPQGVVASVCPSNTTDDTGADYAYRPAVRALIERVKTRIKTP